MRRSLATLLTALRKPLWSYGIFSERLKHERLADGGHRITLELRAEEVTDDAPRPVSSSGPMPMGSSVGAEPGAPMKPQNNS